MAFATISLLQLAADLVIDAERSDSQNSRSHNVFRQLTPASYCQKRFLAIRADVYSSPAYPKSIASRVNLEEM